MKILPFISLFFISLLATSSIAAAEYVTPEKYIVTEVMQRYNLNNENNSYQLACEIGQYVSEEYGWNCDIRQLNFTKHAPVYINVFYPAAENKKGYEAYYGWFGPQKKEVTGFIGKDKKMYYRDWYEPGHECYISGLCSYGTVKSYWGNVSSTDPEVNVTENETTGPEKPDISEPVEVYNNTFVNMGNQTDNNITVITASGNQTIGDNSPNSVNNQGWIGKVEQYWFDFKNANLSNVTFNFFGGN